MKQAWQTIESAPKDGTTILLWHEKQREVMAGVWSMHCDGFADEEHPWLVFDPSDCLEVNAYADGVFTHWMPLPAPPGAPAVPAVPVGMRLVPEAELLRVARLIEGLKQECGMDPESPRAIQNGRYMSIAYILRSMLDASHMAQPGAPT